MYRGLAKLGLISHWLCGCLLVQNKFIFDPHLLHPTWSLTPPPSSTATRTPNFSNTRKNSPPPTSPTIKPTSIACTVIIAIFITFISYINRYLFNFPKNKNKKKNKHRSKGMFIKFIFMFFCFIFISFLKFK